VTQIVGLLFVRWICYVLSLFFFLSVEGPRSRRYGPTAALRLLVHPYDEDKDYDYFLSFSK
jgi:hypothetical protein